MLSTHGTGLVLSTFVYILSPRLHLKRSLLGRKKRPQVKIAFGHPRCAYGLFCIDMHYQGLPCISECSAGFPSEFWTQILCWGQHRVPCVCLFHTLLLDPSVHWPTLKFLFLTQKLGLRILSLVCAMRNLLYTYKGYYLPVAVKRIASHRNIMLWPGKTPFPCI